MFAYLESFKRGQEIDIEQFLKGLAEAPSNSKIFTYLGELLAIPREPAKLLESNPDQCMGAPISVPPYSTRYPHNVDKNVDSDFFRQRLTEQIATFGYKIRSLLHPRPKWYPIDDSTIPKCSNISEVIDQVRIALQTGRKLRACGAQHSVPDAIFEAETLKIKLEGELRTIEQLEVAHDNSWAIYRLGGGCNLGIDPHDESSNISNSVTHSVDKDGFAINILGGMSHQTVAGFISTSSAGGSLKFNFHDCVQAIEFVDGLGNLVTLRRDQDEEFFAVGVSMGLFGIITSIIVKLSPKYWVVGTEQTVPFSSSDVTSGAKMLEVAQGSAVDYFHAVMFPNQNCNTVLQWIGRQSYDFSMYKYVAYKHVLDSNTKQNLAAAALYICNLVDGPGSYGLVGIILNLMNPVGAPISFNDYWWRCLPNDDLTNIDNIIRVQFTEVWIDIKDADYAIAAMDSMFSNNPDTIGTFGIELYEAKKSDMWMSMSYGYDVIRIDPYWFEWNSRGTPDSYYIPFWNLLLKIPSARLHWGKHWPQTGTTYRTEDGKFSRTIGADYCAKSYPRYHDWMQLRSKYDPHQIFVTDYWRGLLGIPLN